MFQVSDILGKWLNTSVIGSEISQSCAVSFQHPSLYYIDRHRVSLTVGIAMQSNEEPHRWWPCSKIEEWLSPPLPWHPLRSIEWYFYLGALKSTNGRLNGAILVVCKSIRSGVASAAEADIGGLFYNGQDAIIIRHSLEALGHPEPKTPIKTDNSTATGFLYDIISDKENPKLGIWYGTGYAHTRAKIILKAFQFVWMALYWINPA